jgi:hypothetical protein
MADNQVQTPQHFRLNIDRENHEHNFTVMTVAVQPAFLAGFTQAVILFYRRTHSTAGWKDHCSLHDGGKGSLLNPHPWQAPLSGTTVRISGSPPGKIGSFRAVNRHDHAGFVHRQGDLPGTGSVS